MGVPVWLLGVVAVVVVVVVVGDGVVCGVEC